MKTISRIAFIFIIALTGIIFIAGQNLDFLVFKYRQNTIRKEIKKQIKEGVSESELIEFDAIQIYTSDAQWIKPGKEFRLNGSMFDVVRKEFKNGKLVFQCINDTQETKLFADLDELVKKRMNGDTDEEKKNLTKDFLKLFFDSEDILWIPSSPVLVSSFLPSFFPYSFSFLSPPPRTS